MLWILPLLPLLRNTIVIRKFAENAMPPSHSKLPTAERENADTAINLDLKRNQRIDQSVKVLFKLLFYTIIDYKRIIGFLEN